MSPRSQGASRRSEHGARAAQSVARAIAVGVEAYERARHLPRILPVGPGEAADHSEAGRRAIVMRLARALRAERNRGRAGHWTYDLNRHIALMQAYAAERRALVVVRKTKPPGAMPPAAEIGCRA